MQGGNLALTVFNTHHQKQAPILASDFLARTRHHQYHHPDCIREYNAATYSCSPYIHISKFDK